MALDVKITINSVKPIGTVGFGVPLILEEVASSEIPYTEVSNLEDVVKAGYDTESEVYKAAQLMFMQEHAPEKIAVCSTQNTAKVWLGAEANVSKDWRQLIVHCAEEDADTSIADISALIEAQTAYPKMFFATSILPVADETLKEAKRTVVVVYPDPNSVGQAAAAIVGEIAGLEVGSYTVNNLIVKGVKGLDLSEEEIEANHSKNCITIVKSAGDVVVSEGVTLGGYYIDDVDGDDYIKMQLEYKTQKVFNNNLKVPYTNVGIALLESAAIDVMTDAVNKGIADTFEVSYALRENTTAEDRANRRYIGGNISYTRAGAIHKIEINCAVSV